MGYDRSGPWVDYTPAWTGSVTNPAIGNGTLHARYRLSGADLMHIEIAVLYGSTTTSGSGAWFFGMPSGWALSGYNAAMTKYAVGGLWVFDSGANIGIGQTVVTPANSDKLDAYYPAGAAATSFGASSEGWSTGDQFALHAVVCVAPA